MPNTPSARAGKTDHRELVAQIMRRGGMRYDPKDMRYLTPRLPNAFEIRIPLKPDAATGERRLINKRITGSHRDAWHKRNDLVLELENNREVEDEDGPDNMITVGELIEKYLDIRSKAHTKERTYNDYCAIAKSRLIPTFGKIKAVKFKADMYEAKVAEWLISGKCQTKRDGIRVELGSGLSKGTIDGHTRLMKMVFKHAHETWRTIPFDPMKGIELFNELKPRIETYSFDELKVLFTAAKTGTKSNRVYSLIFLATFTGARKGELFGLSWKRVNLEECWFQVEEVVAQSKKRGAYIEETPKNRASQRKIFWNKGDLVDQLMHDLHEEYLAVKMRLRTTYDRKDLQLVFSDHLGNPLKPNSFNTSYVKAVQRAGIKYITFHDLRHTFSTLARSNQVRAHVDDIDQRLGHKKDSYGHKMTLHYAHQDILNDRELQRLYENAFNATKAA